MKDYQAQLALFSQKPLSNYNVLKLKRLAKKELKALGFDDSDGFSFKAEYLDKDMKDTEGNDISFTSMLRVAIPNDGDVFYKVMFEGYKVIDSETIERI